MAITDAQTPPRALTRILNPREVERLTGLSAATIWRLRQRGELPEPIRLSPRRVGWPESTIAGWLEQRASR